MGANMQGRHRQQGLTMTGFILTAIVAVTIVMIGFRVLPSYIEYFSVQKVLAKTLQDSKEGFSLYQFRRDFDLKASADYIDSVRQEKVKFTSDDLDILSDVQASLERIFVVFPQPVPQECLEEMDTISQMFQMRAQASSEPINAPEPGLDAEGFPHHSFR